MRILIAGGTGYIGQHLAPFLIENGHQVTILGRSTEHVQSIFKNSSHEIPKLTWEELKSLSDFDIVINLCGVNFAEKRWTAERKQEIIQSRVQPTTTLAELCAKAGDAAPRLFNANAIGVYGLDSTTQFTEESTIDLSNAPDFTSQVTREWQLATRAAKNVVLMRFGVVLSYDGGALKKLKLPYLFGLGGRIGHGQQPFTWVSMADVLNAISFLIDHPEIHGPINIVAPEKTTQIDFAKALGHALNRPTFMITPAWLTRLIFGQLGDELLLQGQFVRPKRLLDLGYRFINPTLEKTL